MIKTPVGEVEFSPLQITHALRSSVRLEILISMRSAGPVTVSQLAKLLGLPADSLYHHIGILLQAGLIQEVDRRKSGRHMEAVYERSAEKFLPPGSGSTENVKNTISIVDSIMRAVSKGLKRSLSRFDHGSIPGVRTFHFGYESSWLTAEDVRMLGEHLGKIDEILERGRQRREGMLFTFFRLGFVDIRERKRRASKSDLDDDSDD